MIKFTKTIIFLIIVDALVIFSIGVGFGFGFNYLKESAEIASPTNSQSSFSPLAIFSGQTMRPKSSSWDLFLPGGDLGVGTTTSNKTFAVHGDALISGDLNTAGLTASGTVTLLNTTNGVLVVDGGGVVSASSTLGIDRAPGQVGGSGDDYAWDQGAGTSATGSQMIFNGGFVSTASSTVNAQLNVSGPLSASSSLNVAGISTINVLRFDPETDQTITSAGDTINSSRTHLDIQSGADIVLTSTPTIAAGENGQFLIIHNVGTTTIDIQDESILAGSTIYLGRSESTLAASSTMTLYYSVVSSVGGWYIVSNPNSATAGANADLLEVRNQSGSAIAAGKAVYITGWNNGQNRPTIDLADADDSSKVPAIGITSATIGNGTNGDVVSFGESVGTINTSSAAVGDGVWLSTTAGELSFDRPLIDDIQRIGTVARSSVSQGVVLVTGAGRTNDTPWNIDLTEASTTRLSVFDTAYFGGTATSTFDSVGNLSLAGTFGLGTSTPGRLFSVHGNGLFSGNLNIAGLNATGTVTFLNTTSGVLVTNSNGVMSASSTLGIDVAPGVPATAFNAGAGLSLTGTTFSLFGLLYNDVISATSSLSVGTSTPSKLFSVQGNGILSGTLRLANLIATGTLNVTGETTLTGGLISNASTSLASTLHVNGMINASSSMAVDGTVNFASTLNVTGNTTLSGTLGVGTTTPAKLLSVQGDAIISGTLSTANLTATGTSNLGLTDGVIVADSDGLLSASSTLGIDVAPGSGGGASEADWEILGETVAMAATTSVEVQVASSTQLRIIVLIPTKIEGTSSHLRFNRDNGNYYYRYAPNYAAAQNNVHENGLWLQEHSVHTNAMSAWIELDNVGGEIKNFMVNDIKTGARATAYRVVGSGHWANSTSTITTIALLSNNGGRYATGTRVTVWGRTGE